MPERAATPLSIALFGASGDIGSRIAEEALARGHRVTALVRNPAQMSGEHPQLKIVRGDATDPLQVAVVARNHDVVASAISAPPNDLAVIVHAAKALVAGARETGKRVVAVGGAGSLEVAPGKLLLDSAQFPSFVRPVAAAHLDALKVFKEKGDDAPWTVVSPSAFIEPGRRTGTFRLGTEQLISDKKGNSRISMEDYAVAFVDELERGDHVGQRMTVGY
ncbi:MAG: NAD(P)H-binding protein [Candidatus Thermoplasmatota archaeon]